MIESDWQQGRDVDRMAQGWSVLETEKNSVTGEQRAGEERKKSAVENEVRPYTGRSCRQQLWCCSEAVGSDQRALIPLAGLGRMGCLGGESITRRGGGFCCSLGVNGRGLVRMVGMDNRSGQ